MYFFNFVSWCRFFVYWYWNFGSCNHFVLFHVLTHVLCISTGMIQLLQTCAINSHSPQYWPVMGLSRFYSEKTRHYVSSFVANRDVRLVEKLVQTREIKEGERGESAVTSANRFVIRCPQPVRVGSRAMQVVILVPLTGIRCHRWIIDLTRQRTSSLRIPTSHQTDTCRYLKGSLLICTKSSLHDWSEHIRASKVGCCK